jgi:Uma2 family endonuclease
MAVEQKLYTVEEFERFVNLPDNADKRFELINGKPTFRASHTPGHQLLVGNMSYLLRQLVPNGRVCIAPSEVYLDDQNLPQPDVLWIAENSKCVIAKKRLEGPPDLVVEVLSPSTAHYDKTFKFLLYEKYGVREYWLVEPAKRQVEVWKLAGAKYAEQGIFGEDETFDSAVLGGKTVEVSAIFTG